MATKYVSDTKAGKSISAWVVFNRRNQLVATVRAHFSDRGVCLVNVFNTGKSKVGESLPFQSATASGYGYDKLTAALSGLIIDGHKLSNHCESYPKKPKSGLWPRDSKPPKGYQYANWIYRDDQRNELPKEKQGYGDCYKISGLPYLEALGYRVLSAI